MTKFKCAFVALVIGIAALPATASAIAVDVDLGTAASFAVLGGSTVTNTGSSVITGDLGVSPGTAVTGFPPGVLLGGLHSADAVAAQAQVDLGNAYNAAALQAPDANISGDLGALTKPPGVYRATSSIGLTGTLTLDAAGDPDAVWIFQIGTTQTTSTGSIMSLISGAQ
jgi:hypothetical protein